MKDDDSKGRFVEEEGMSLSRKTAAPRAHRILILMIFAGEALATHELQNYAGNLLYQIQNPFAYIPRIELENHFDSGEGPTDSSTYRLRLRPILPFQLTDDFNLLTRATLALKYQSSLWSGGPNHLGYGDTDLEFYFTPRESLAHDSLLIGFGPSIHLPTATQPSLGLNQWGAGLSGAFIWQPGTLHALRGWTFAFNINQSFGFASKNGTQPLSLLFLLPSATYTTEEEITFGADIEPYYNWTDKSWTAPLNLWTSYLIEPFTQPVIITLDGRYYVARTPYDPKWGLQINFNFLFPD